ncbi:FAD-dependent oxidoreductase [Candidatus Woesearchaeota archaeon]|nr:FAD-dependent oxidoreductase [Candidatus Woesearchaeota archaeon]
MKFKAKILESLQETPRTKIIRLTKPKDFVFHPGQWVSVWCDDYKDENNNPVRRAFSIASCPSEEHLELCIARGKNFSAYFQDLPVGAFVNVEGPFGTFALHPGKKIMFIAGGSGVAPFRPMIMQALDEKREVLLIYSIRIPSDFTYQKEFESIDNPKFKLVPTITFDHHFKAWEGERGRVQDFLKKYYKKEYDVYLCGPPPMVEAMIQKLKQLKHPDKKIFVDKWS